MISSRVLNRELMDDPGIDPEEHRQALRGLARLNRASMINGVVWRELRRIAGDEPVRVLDVAAGSGDLALAIAGRSADAGLGYEVTCLDVSPTACGAAEERAVREGRRIKSVIRDAIRDGIPGEYDVVMCHLFLHHLGRGDVVTLLRSMKNAARLGVLITDLDRTPLGLALAFAASRTMTRSRVVHTDAVLSVRSAFRPRELRRLASEAGLDGATVRRVWPERMALVWERSS